MSPAARPLSGRTCVLTGATSGLGRAAALALAALGADLLLVGRSEVRGARVARLARRRNPEGRVEFLQADLASQGSVRALAAAIARRIDRVDVLVNSAGARLDRYAESPDGVELTFATNHLGHFLLTHLLRERLERARGGRVITVGSSAHAAADLHRGFVLQRGNYDRRIAYANSKLANVVFARELAAQADPALLTSNAVDPGVAATRFARNNGLLSWTKHLVAHGLRGELTSARRGADTIVHLAASEAVAGVTGRYFRRRAEVAPSPLAADPAVGRELWRLSLELTGLAADAASCGGASPPAVAALGAVAEGPGPR
jgi:NAD(P)-dependent dehydrogenase (short-subunit alcohol dehydrogenase family)